MRRRRTFAAAAGGAAVTLGLLVHPGVGSGTVAVVPHRGLSPMQFRLLSGGAEQALLSIGALSASAENPTKTDGAGEDPPAIASDISPGGAVAGPGISGGPANIVPGTDGACRVNLGGDVKVNTDCESISDPALHGRGQAQNETAIAVNPVNRNQLIASQNDYRRGDGQCGSDWSRDGGQTWGSALAPQSFIIDPVTHHREYWQAGGDTSVGFDSSGTAYLMCQVFNRGAGATDSPDQNSAFLLFRSGDGGASWTFTGRPVTFDQSNDGSVLADKEYMAIDRSGGAYDGRIYVTWTEFAADGTAYILEKWSSDHGDTWNGPAVVSGDSSLCPNTYGLPTPNGGCNENQFSDPIVGSDGSLYVVWANFNNGLNNANDNHNQMLFAKSTDGGATFSAPVQAANYNDLPDCFTYTGQDAFRACVPIKAAADAAHQPSVFRATNYPTITQAGGSLYVFYGSYINQDSRPANGCTPQGISGDTGFNLYNGVTTAGACSNKILVSVSSDGGSSFSATGADPATVAEVSGGNHADQFWPWSTTTSGKPAVTFYDRRYGSDESTGYSDVSVVIGHGSAQRATSGSMPPPTQFADAQGHGLFYGDYIGIAARGNTVFPIWSDTRDIGVTSCPSDNRRICSYGNDQDVFTTPVGGGDNQNG